MLTSSANRETTKVTGRISPCHTPRKNPAARGPAPSSGFGPAAHADSNSTRPQPITQCFTTLLFTGEVLSVWLPRSRSSAEVFVEERHDPVQRRSCGVTWLVHQVHGEHRVSSSRDAVRVARRGVDLDALEAVAQLAAQGLEALRGAPLVPGKAQPQDGQPLACAKPPVRHMPIAPTPGPPHSAWALAARARSQVTTGLVRSASTANSRDTQTRST